MDRLKSGFDFIFSSYKRSAAALFILAILLAIPVTVSFIGEQQDIRQRASGLDTITSLLTPTPTQTSCLVKPAKCSNLWSIIDSDCRTPSGGWCTTSPTPTQAPSPTASFPSPTGTICAQVITLARNTTTSTCQQFPTSCLPQGWVPDSSCQNATPTPFSTSNSCSACSTQSPFSCTYTILGRTTTFCSPINISSLGYSCIKTCGVSPTPTGVQIPTATATPTPTIFSPSATSIPSLSPTGSQNQCTLKAQGDANCDGKVNTDDFNIWRDEFLGNSTTTQSDFNNSNGVNTDDFNIWRDGFLNTAIPH